MIKRELNPIHGKRLKECLTDANMSQKDLSIKSGYTQQYISNIIVGKKNMSLESARIFSRILNVREEYLLCEDNTKSEKESRNIFIEKSNSLNDLTLKLLHLSGFVPICDFIGNWKELSLSNYTLDNIPSELEKQLKYSTEIFTSSGNTFYCDMEDIHLLGFELLEYIKLRMKQLESKYAWLYDDCRLSHRSAGSTIRFYPHYSLSDRKTDYLDFLNNNGMWLDHEDENFPNIEFGIDNSLINNIGELI